MSVSLLTDSPTRRDDSETFSNRTENLFISLKNFVDDFNSNALDLMGFSLDASVLLSFLNFKGEWSDLTGAANIPYTVTHDKRFWVLLNDSPDITTIEPSSSSEFWVDVNAFISELRDNDNTEDIILGKDDSYIQVFTPDNPDLTVKIGEATQFNKGFLFQIINNGDYAVWITRYDDEVIGYLEPDKFCYIFLTDNSSANGVWFTANQI